MAVGFGGRHLIRLRIRASSAARRALTTAVRHRLARCIDRPPPQLACPLPSSRYVPGSLSGRVLEPVRLRFAVASEPPGLIRVAGVARFRGSYRRLGYDNLAHRHTGQLTLRVHASAYAVHPVRLVVGVPR